MQAAGTEADADPNDCSKIPRRQPKGPLGLAGRHVVLPDEDPAEYDRLIEELTAEHQPAGPTERFLVEQMAQAQWKLERIARMEARMFARQLESGAAPDAAAAWENDCAAANSLFKLSRYEATARRAWFKALAQLQSLRAPRRAEDANRVADDRLCEFIEHYINSPLPPLARPPHPQVMKITGGENFKIPYMHGGS